MRGASACQRWAKMADGSARKKRSPYPTATPSAAHRFAHAPIVGHPFHTAEQIEALERANEDCRAGDDQERYMPAFKLHSRK